MTLQTTITNLSRLLPRGASIEGATDETREMWKQYRAALAKEKPSFKSQLLASLFSPEEIHGRH